jgi:signal transduction histidine kinase
MKVNLWVSILFFSKKKPTSMQKLMNSIFKKLDMLYSIFGGRTIALLSFALIIAVATMFFSDSLIMKMKAKDAEGAEISEALLHLSELQTSIYAAESAQRGYLATSENQYLRPYDEALVKAKAHISDLENFIEKNKYKNQLQKEREKEILSKISANFEAKATEMRLTIQLIDSGGKPEANKIINMDVGLKLMTKIVFYSKKLSDIYNKSLQEVIRDRAKSTTYARGSVILGTLVLIILVVLVIQQLLKELSEKSKLQNQLIEINEINESKLKSQSRLLAKLALDNQTDVERERQKLARELHDELGSILTATKMDVSWVIKTLKGTRPDIVEKLERTKGYLDQGINFKRVIVQELHPSMISNFGFWPALKNLIDDAVERNKWELILTLPDENTQINETISLVAYRVVQEALNNCSKYAQATKMRIHIVSDDHNLKIEIEDNGAGMDVLSLDGNTHGLSGMRHRILAIGGTFELKSTLGNGVFALVILPLNINSN